jgi:hypothetical protein
LKSYTEYERNFPVIAISTIALQPKLFDKLNILTACIFEIQSPTTTIIELISVLETTNRELKKGEVIVTAALQTRKVTVTVDNFLKDSESRYINAQRALEILKPMLLEYYTLHDELPTDSIGVAGHNRRVLTLFTNTLSELTNSLLEYSYVQK